MTEKGQGTITQPQLLKTPPSCPQIPPDRPAACGHPLTPQRSQAGESCWHRHCRVLPISRLAFLPPRQQVTHRGGGHCLALGGTHKQLSNPAGCLHRQSPSFEEPRLAPSLGPV